MATYNYNDDAIISIGRHNTSYASNTKDNCSNNYAGWMFKYNGSQSITVHIASDYASGAAKVYFNGVAQTNPTISPSGITNDGTFTLSPADGDVVLIQVALGYAGNLAMLKTGAIVTQGTDTISLPTGFSKTLEYVEGTNIQTYALCANIFPSTTTSYDGSGYFTNPNIGKSDWPQHSITFRATVTGLFYVGYSTIVGLWVDGVRHSVTTASGSRIHVKSLATDLDGTAEHEYRIVGCGATNNTENGGTSSAIDQIGFVGGTGLSTTSPAASRPYKVVVIGDSFEDSSGNSVTSSGPTDTGTNSSQMDGYPNRLCETLPINVYSYGIHGATVDRYLSRLRDSKITGTTSGTFTNGETVTQETTGASAVVNTVGMASGILHVGVITGTPNATNTWTGQTSGATCASPAMPVSWFPYPTTCDILVVGGLENDTGTSQSSIEASLKGIVIAAVAKWPDLKRIIFRPTKSTSGATLNGYAQNVATDLNSPTGSEGTTYNGMVVIPTMAEPPIATSGETIDGQHPNGKGNEVYRAAIAGEIADTLTPTLGSIIIPSGGDSITATLSLGCTPSSWSGSNGFTISASGGSVTVTSGTITDGTAVALALSRTINSGETVTISYSASTGTIAVASSIDLPTFSDQSVTNNSSESSSSRVSIIRTIKQSIKRPIICGP